MFALSMFLLAAGFAQPAATPIEEQDAFTCSVRMDSETLRGTMWRQFDPRWPDDRYVIQLRDRSDERGPSVSWTVDNRPLPRRLPRDHGYGRPESEIFRQGPDAVDFGSIETGELSGERIWAQLFGDGVYSGAHLALTARDSRRLSRRGARSIAVVLSHRYTRDLVARLAGAREWRVVLVTEAGRVLGERTVIVPTSEQARAAFEQARRELMANRDAFVAGRAAAVSEAHCEIEPPADATI